ncbi:MAG: DEAD/DEAH box helicase [Promethearchaeota archaeon]
MTDSDRNDFVNHPLLRKDTVFRRAYQEKIFASCIGKNSMVVLPTAMGKTIIALMLSVFHLSDEIDKKIIFLAPTKPLVVQHQETFKNMTVFGDEEWQIPVLTGSTVPEKRERIFLDAKIAFMTPQVLQNDILGNRINLSDVSLIIFDEAHRAVGDYAYTFIAEIYSQKNTTGQILAMSASPGGNEKKIKEVCQNLKIENIEIKSAESSDVKPYIQDVKMNWIHIEMPDEYYFPKKELEELQRKFYKELYKNNFLDSFSINKISRKMLLAGSKKIDLEIKRHRNDDSVSTFFSMKKIISNSIRVSHMLELLEAQGIEPLHKYFKKCIAELKGPKSSKSLRELFVMDRIRTALQSINKLIESEFLHPKLKKLGEILRSQLAKNPESRILVFANFRDSISSILSHLEQFPEVRAERFVGQANRKSGKKVLKGMNQKEQIRVLSEFKSGTFNTLVATSVAEEGLDIAECDLVIFYDVVPSEIRSIQRRGRTGRQSKGEIIILMAKGTREEGYYWAAKNREKQMKKSLKKLKNTNLDYKQKGISAEKSNVTTNKVERGTNLGSSKKKGSILDYMQSVDQSKSMEKISEKKAVHEKKVTNKEKTNNSEIYIKSSEENREKYVVAEELGGVSKGFTLIADNRETKSSVVRNLALKGVDLILKNLPVADYIIPQNSQNVGIERKEAVDYNRSVIDGRLFDELHRLSQNFSTPILIVEGNPVGVTGVSKEAILGSLASIIINMRITVLYSESSEETADIIFAFIKKVQEKKDSKEIIYKRKTSSIAEAQEQVIGGIPGVNLIRAQELLTHFSNIKNIINADEDELTDVKGIGSKTAKKIKEVSESDYNSTND